MSAGLSLYYKGWTFGGGIRRTFVSHKYADMNVRSPRRPEGFDAYRDAWAANIGVGYEIGPVKTALTYFIPRLTAAIMKTKSCSFPAAIS